MNYVDDDITRYLANASSLLCYINSSRDTKTANTIASSVIARTKDVKLGLVSSSSVMSFTSTQLLGCIDPSSDTKVTIASCIIAKSKDVSLPWLINEVYVLTTRSIVKVIDVLAAAKMTKNNPTPPPLNTIDLSSTPSYDDFLDYVFNNKALPIIVADVEGLLCNNVKNTNVSITPASQVVPTSVDVVTGASTTTKEYIDQLHLTAIPPSPSLPTSTTATITNTTTTTTTTTNDNESTLAKKLELVLDTTFLSTDSSGSSDDSYKSQLDDDDDDDVYAEVDNDDVGSIMSGGGGSSTWSFSDIDSDDSSSKNSNISNINEDEDYYHYVDNDEDTTSIGTIDGNIVDYAAFHDDIVLNIDKDHTVQDGEAIVVDNKKQLLSFEELYMSNDVEYQGEKSGQHCIYDEAAALAADDDDMHMVEI